MVLLLFIYFPIFIFQEHKHLLIKKCTVKTCFLCIEAKLIFTMDFIEDRTNIYIYIYHFLCIQKVLFCEVLNLLEQSISSYYVYLTHPPLGTLIYFLCLHTHTLNICLYIEQC